MTAFGVVIGSAVEEQKKEFEHTIANSSQSTGVGVSVRAVTKRLALRKVASRSLRLQARRSMIIAVLTLRLVMSRCSVKLVSNCNGSISFSMRVARSFR